MNTDAKLWSILVTLTIGSQIELCFLHLSKCTALPVQSESLKSPCCIGHGRFIGIRIGIKSADPNFAAILGGKSGWGGRIRKLTAAPAKPSKIGPIQCFQQF